MAEHAGITSIQNWQTWKKLWEDTSFREFGLILVETGFGVPVSYPDEWIERCCRYLEIANGHDKLNERSLKRHFSQNDGNVQELLIARRAFEILCLELFVDKKDPWSSGPEPSWMHDILQPVLLKKIFWFFRLEDSRIANLSHCDTENPSAKIAHTFLVELCKFLWKGDNLVSPRSLKNEKRWDEVMLETNRLHTIDVLFGLKTLGILLYVPEEIEKSCLEKMSELVLKQKHWFPASHGGNEYREPQTVEEAVYANSNAAKVLLLLRIKQRERQRLEQIQELSIKRRECDAEMSRLNV